eukprot:122313_1
MKRCCSWRWGKPCAYAAKRKCNNYATCCGCLNSGRHAGCYNDMQCSKMICDSDPFCCYKRWDDMCVVKADAICNDEPIPTCCECTSKKYIPGCSADPTCQAEICAADSFC